MITTTLLLLSQIFTKKEISQSAAQVEDHVQVGSRDDFIFLQGRAVVETLALENQVDLRLRNAFTFLKSKFELSNLNIESTVSSSSTLSGIVFPVRSRILIYINNYYSLY